MKNSKTVCFLALFVTILALSGCRVVQVESLSDGNLSGGITGPDGSDPAHILVGTTDLFNQPFHNMTGTIEFHNAGLNQVQIYRSCSTEDCQLQPAEERFDAILEINNPSSIYTRNYQNQIWTTRLTGSSDLLVLTTTMQSVSGQMTEAIQEYYRVSSDPCYQGMGQGLELRSVKTLYSGRQIQSSANTNSISTTSTCQVFL